MAKKDAIVYKYFKRVFDDFQVLVALNPIDYSGTELIIHPDGKVEKNDMQYDEDIYDDLEVDEFKESSPLEFQLYMKKEFFTRKEDKE
ncbi:hypothetical protein BXY85_0513 [Roseivirga pacifica]|uniref:Uncharacterized protein n=1 Tax=Roseivirga pacifica TaxID=1267423 RepID=A0A1I0RFV4_9BACT|nr:hypothetical protein [Roseivirga pacifica]MCO6357587.1 hypothetical protein [Roseivirga pacifica]MCO6365840.1 hypothetical protein [Roseivirga pacifica]MCO6371169.1 hypothetical protein [Roseivirga pacifica]MCO6375660.1 hypothetical protein [Roseivirga pacifica]MCO6378547.1 hypothetical protein [Roseivirga pacifica]|tara:strand:- start:344 stop:607 length:264 start_codon:yes stop_codon:yes gene_type:complete